MIDWTFSDSPEFRAELAAVIERAAVACERDAERSARLAERSKDREWAAQERRARDKAQVVRRVGPEITERWAFAGTCGDPRKAVEVVGVPKVTPYWLRFDLAAGLGQVRPGVLTMPALWLLVSSMILQPGDHRLTQAHRFLDPLAKQMAAGLVVPLSQVVELLDAVDMGGVYPLFNDPCLGEWDSAEQIEVAQHHVERVARYAERGMPWALRLIGRVPHLADHVLARLTTFGLEGTKEDRPAIRQVLAARGDAHRPLVIAALGDGRWPVRLEAAQWLRREPGADAVAGLERAFAKERQDAVVGALLDALVAAGRPVTDYLGLGTLIGRASRTLAKGLPKELGWVVWETAPPLRWADGSVVDQVVVQWLLTMAVRSKSSEPGSLTRAYASLWDQEDAQEFGLWLLRGWLAADVVPIDATEAVTRANQEAVSEANWMVQCPDSFAGHPRLGWSVEQISAALLPRIARTPGGSVISSKGVLGVVAATARGGVAPMVGAYLKEWFGSRAAQGKALIAMLGWVEDRAATGLLLSIGSRFRTKSFSEEAARVAEGLAERQGWTLAQLADRSVPTAGMDEHGVLELSYGDRLFTARVSDDLVFVVSDPDGKVVKALPPARVVDDGEAVKSAKKTLTAAKKELKDTVVATSDRLYEAMVARQSWSGVDWHQFVLEHPIVGRLATRVLWQVRDEDADMVVRPLADGTISDVTDTAVTVGDDATVCVAHSSTMTPHQVNMWVEHLADYEVKALFDQLTYPRFSVDPDSELAELTDLRGHVVGGFAFRTAAIGLGYQRGDVGIGGWLMDYRKHFPALGLTAVVGFTGNSLPEEDRPVAITDVSFIGEEGTVMLNRVPPILLSEVHTDAVQIASTGTGFDEDWETTTAW